MITLFYISAFWYFPEHKSYMISGDILILEYAKHSVKFQILAPSSFSQVKSSICFKSGSHHYLEEIILYIPHAHKDRPRLFHKFLRNHLTVIIVPFHRKPWAECLTSRNGSARHSTSKNRSARHVRRLWSLVDVRQSFRSVALCYLEHKKTSVLDIEWRSYARMGYSSQGHLDLVGNYQNFSKAHCKGIL